MILNPDFSFFCVVSVLRCAKTCGPTRIYPRIYPDITSGVISADKESAYSRWSMEGKGPQAFLPAKRGHEWLRSLGFPRIEKKGEVFSNR